MTKLTCVVPEYDPLGPLVSDTDVLYRVEQIIGYDSRRDRSLWLFFLGADAVQLPVVVTLDDVPAYPVPGAAASICEMTGRVLASAAPGGSVVITLVPENERGGADCDQQWTSALRAAAARAGVHLRMICLAATEGVRRLEPSADPSHLLAED